ncbi:MAG TPA: hypothetical protein PLT82_04550 [Candidatus Hydrogenedens sp.]|nr:hypothetical protein [Candidatus Hydrogenedens sp.]HOK09518.1 hypothetical protein [Candidatus Hydrogenedens sp.]HOL18792.1 hypothetical protein [Candidatus Hydrogenedens sp.]HPP58381.1 hypothetical protein [Candidatus Hydrogenedens sp.]
MRVQSFIGKASVEGLHQMDNLINDWIKRTRPKIIQIAQCPCTSARHDGRDQETIIVVTILYQESEV